MNGNRAYKILHNQIFKQGDYRIVPVRDKDKYDIMRWRNEQIYHLRQKKPLTKQEQEKYFREVVDKLFEQDKPEQILFSYLKKDKCIGYGGIVHINWPKQSGEISFLMDTSLENREFEKHWTIFLSLVDRLAFDELGLRKIYIYAFDVRPHLYPVLEKNGYKLTEIRKKIQETNEGKVDVLIYEKRRPDFNDKLKTVFLASGNLGYHTLEKLYESTGFLDWKLILTDKNSEDIISFCQTKNIPFYTGNPRKEEKKILEIMHQSGNIDVLFSVNYLFIIPESIINIPLDYAFNIHGSLLPKYRGRTPHVWAIINGEKHTGISIHRMEKEVDAGDIVWQEKIDILPEDTGNDILLKFKKMYPEAVRNLLSRIYNRETLVFHRQDERKATYFGKRTPEDGLINWHWYKERILNWIRAQAKPYPGAFTFYEGHKLIIHKAVFSDRGYRYDMPDGMILDAADFIVKTPNGAVQIIDYEWETNKKIILEENKILSK